MSEFEFVGNRKTDFTPVDDISAWESYRNHREIVTGFIRSSVPPLAESLSVWGAGQCYDIDLKLLCDRFSKITLVDINRKHLQEGVEMQGLERLPAIGLMGNTDLFGLHKMLGAFKDDPTAERFDAILQQASSFTPATLGKFDCVVSTCLLSQLLFQATEAVSEQHPQFVDLLQAIRLRHIELMLDSLNEKGVGILVTDFVSTESLPELFTTSDLKDTVQRAISKRNFLHGLNPAMVGQVFAGEHIKTQLKSMKITDPWRWAMPMRIYACFAIIFTKH